LILNSEILAILSVLTTVESGLVLAQPCPAGVVSFIAAFDYRVINVFRDRLAVLAEAIGTSIDDLA
jgi:hypothetical protein